MAIRATSVRLEGFGQYGLGKLVKGGGGCLGFEGVGFGDG